MKKFIDYLLNFLQLQRQSHCVHRSSEFVVADYLEGDCLPVSVKWCRKCGAIARQDGDYGYRFDYPNPNLTSADI